MRLLFHSLLERVAGGGSERAVRLNLDVQGQGGRTILGVVVQWEWDVSKIRQFS